MDTLGVHYIAEMWKVDYNKLDNIKEIENQMKEAVKVAKGNALNVFSHKFSPHGVSCVITISESHLSIHTFPEVGYCAVDIYTCGKTHADRAIKHLIKHFEPKNHKVVKLVRGKEKVQITTDPF